MDMMGVAALAPSYVPHPTCPILRGRILRAHPTDFSSHVWWLATKQECLDWQTRIRVPYGWLLSLLKSGHYWHTRAITGEMSWQAAEFH